MSSSKRDFRIIKLCQKLCLDITEMQGKGDKSYRYTICQDLRKKSEDVIHIVRKANVIPAGNEERIKLQYEADDLLEDIKDLIWVAGKLLNTGVKKEAQIELSIENLQIPLHNWMERDQKIAVSMREKVVRKLSWDLFHAKKVNEAVLEYHSKNPTERTVIALDESKSRLRIAYKEYERAILSYDEAIKRLRTTQERYHKDDSVLAEILKEIESETGRKIALDTMTLKNSADEKILNDKKEILDTANKKILESNEAILSSGTKEKIGGNFS